MAFGLIALFGFFAALGLFAPKDVLWLYIVAGVLVIVTAIHSFVVRRNFNTHGNQEFFRPADRLRLLEREPNPLGDARRAIADPVAGPGP